MHKMDRLLERQSAIQRTLAAHLLVAMLLDGSMFIFLSTWIASVHGADAAIVNYQHESLLALLSAPADEGITGFDFPGRGAKEQAG
jgi:hypothetical protein